MLRLQLTPASADQSNRAHHLNLLWISTEKDHNVETRSTVIGPNLNRHYILNTRDLYDLARVVFGQSARCRAKSIFLKDDQTPFGIGADRKLVQPFLNRSHDAENEDRNGRPQDGQQRSRPMSSQGPEYILKHVTPPLRRLRQICLGPNTTVALRCWRLVYRASPSIR